MGALTTERVLIHSIDDTKYPVVDSEGPRISSWFRAEFYDLYHNGVEFRLTLQSVLLGPDGQWTPRPWNDKRDFSKLQQINAWVNGCIPYRNIVEIDPDGDEYYSEPRLYCRFAEAGEPYEEIRYRAATGYPLQLEPKLRMTVEELLKLVAG